MFDEGITMLRNSGRLAEVLSSYLQNDWEPSRLMCILIDDNKE